MPDASGENSRNTKLLDEEIHAITLKLHDDLKGSEPVCVSVYQPTPTGGRLSLIDRVLDEQNRVAALSPGKGARHSFLNPSDDLPWKVVPGNVDEPMLDDYVSQNPETVRMDILSIYQDRFASRVKLNTENGHVVIGTHYRLCYVCPTSLNQTNPSAHLPRLGLVYTFGSSFGKKSRLLNAARIVSDVILDVRLRNLLRDVGQFGPRGRSGSRPAWEIAADLGEGIDITLEESIFLITKLLLVHHHFYPQHPLAYYLIAKLVKDPAQVFGFHGLDTPLLAPFDERKSISQLMADLSSDFLSLAGACAWNRNTNNTHAMQVAEEGRRLITDAFPIALTLLCGSVSHGYIDKSIKQSLKNKGDFQISPPPGIPLSSRNLPTFAYEEVKSDAGDADVKLRARAFIETLHPLGPTHVSPSWRGFYAIKNQGWVSFRGERVTQRPAKDWFVSYVRARCINAFESLDPFRES